MPTLSAVARKQLPSSAFAGSGRSYPIPDINHARLALAMSAKYASPAEHARIMAAVRARYPGIK